MRCATATLAALFAISFTPLSAAAEPGPSRSPAVVPERAWLDLDLDPQSHSFEGRVVFELRILAAVNAIRLQAKNLRIASAELLTEAGRTIALRVDEPQIAGELQLLAPQILAPGEARLELRFAGHYQQGGIAREQDAAGKARVVRSAQGEVGTVVPAFDAADIRHPWELSLAVPAHLQASAMTEQVGIEKVRDGWRRLRFAPTEPLAARELSFRVQPHESGE